MNNQDSLRETGSLSDNKCYRGKNKNLCGFATSVTYDDVVIQPRFY